MAGTDQRNAVLSALGDPTRRAILDELAERDATVTELSAPLPRSMPADVADGAFEKLDATLAHLQAATAGIEV